MDLIWRSEKVIKSGTDLIWQFLPFCGNCAKFSPRQNLNIHGKAPVPKLSVQAETLLKRRV